MAWKTPTLKELSVQVRQSFRANLSGTDAALWPNNIYVSAKVIAVAVLGNYRWLEYIKNQAFVTTAEGEFLDRHGRQYGIVRHPASYAEGMVEVLGVAGAYISSGTVFIRQDGVEYKALESVIIGGNGETSIKVRALEPGKIYNTLSGVELGSGGDGFSSASVADTGIGLGADDETDEPYRSRILFHLQQPPHGGAAHDYVEWARKTNGVSDVFVDPLNRGPGTLGIYILMRDIYENGIPQVADIAGIQAYIDVVKPVTAVPTVIVPAPVAVDIEIGGLVPDTATVRDAVVLELQDLFSRIMVVSTLKKVAVVRQSKIWEAISQAAGEDYHTLDQPAADIVLTEGQVAILGNISFV